MLHFQYCLPSFLLASDFSTSCFSHPVLYSLSLSLFFWTILPSSVLSVSCISRPSLLNISVSLLTPLFSLSPSVSLAAFSKLNSRVNPCSFRPPEKKEGQKGKDSSLFGISIKMKLAPYFCTPKKEDRGRWRMGERQEQGTQSKGKRRVKEEECRKKKKKWKTERPFEGTEGKD